MKVTIQDALAKLIQTFTTDVFEELEQYTELEAINAIQIELDKLREFWMLPDDTVFKVNNND